MTMKQLYQLHTGDLASHQRAIDARVKRLPEDRQRILQAAIAGESLRDIAAREGVSHGTIQSSIRRSLEAVRKDIAREPRYNRVGRSKKTPAPELQPV